MVAKISLLKRMKILVLAFVSGALLLAAGCKPKAKQIPAIQRKEAANLVSEAQFAVTLRDYARAEPLFEKAANLCPDTGDYWVDLGVVRRRLDNKSGAKAAYKEALGAFRDAAELDPNQSDAMLQEINVLLLLGRVDEARDALQQARKKLPDDRALRNFDEGRQLERILADPAFKEIAL